MSMEFGFAYGPAEADGHFTEIFKPGMSELRPEYTAIEEIGLPKYGTKHVVQALGLNFKAQELLDDATNGWFFRFMQSDENWRYLRLAPRLPELTELKELLPGIQDEYLRLWLELFLENCEHALDVAGDRAILLIY